MHWIDQPIAIHPPGNKPEPEPEKRKDGGYRTYDFEGTDNEWVAY
jgi:hypothetical protein